VNSSTGARATGIGTVRPIGDVGSGGEQGSPLIVDQLIVDHRPADQMALVG
jgi:hypothetical protein